MAKIKVLVVEDESIVSKDIQSTLKRLGYTVVGSSSTGKKAIELAKEKQPDIILMDIMLKGEMSGIEVASEIKKEQNIPIIFLTAYADKKTLEQAKVTEPHGYILKPFKSVDLESTIEMSLYKHQKENEVLKERDLLYSIVENKSSQDFIFVKSNSKIVRLKTTDIYFIEALKDYVVINTLDKRYTIHSSMKGMVDKMDEHDFVRIHRSFIVRMDKIKSIQYPDLELDDIQRIFPVGGVYKDQLKKKINLI